MGEWTIHRLTGTSPELSYTRTHRHPDGADTLILCHGLTDNGRCWYRVARALEQSFDIVMPDARNHGLSGDGPVNPQTMSEDLKRVLDDTGADTAVVLGHSVGAVAAASFAAHYPDRVTKLILEDPPWRKESTSSGRRDTAQTDAFAAYIDDMKSRDLLDIESIGRAQHPAWDQDDLPDWAVAKQQVRRDAMASLDIGDWKELTGALTCPTLLLFGDQDDRHDGILSRSLAEDIVATQPRVLARHLPGAGHNMRREVFDDYLAAVRIFLT